MISHLVNPALNFLQEKLYEVERRFLVDETRVYRDYYPFLRAFGEGIKIATIDQSLIVNRLLAVPVVAIDLALESLRPLLKAVESAALTLVSLGFVFYNLLLLNGGEMKRSMRLTILNLNNAVENLVLTPIKIIATPLFASAQLILTEINPLISQPSNLNFPVVYSGRPGDGQVLLDPLSPDRGKSDNFEYRIYRGLTRLSAIPVSCIDALSEVVIGIAKTVMHAVLGFIFVGFSILQLCMNATAEAEKSFRLGISAFATAVHQLAATISKTIMLPITLISQIATTLWDPKHALPISRGIYSSQPGDYVLTLHGFERVPEAIEPLEVIGEINVPNSSHVATTTSTTSNRRQSSIWISQHSTDPITGTSTTITRLQQ